MIAAKTGSRSLVKLSLIFMMLVSLLLLLALNAKETHAFGAIMGGPHDLTITGSAVGAAYPDGACRVCHIPHNSQDIRLWPRTGPTGTPFVDNGVLRMCYDCHAYNTDDGTNAGVPLWNQLPLLNGVIFGDPGLSPPRIVDRTGNPLDINLVPINVNHQTGRDNCTSCHPHDEGFLQICNTCHGFPPGYDDLSDPNDKVGTLGFPDTASGPTVPEVGAHLRHILDELGTTTFPGYPKIGTGACLNAGCHVNILDHNQTVDGGGYIDGQPHALATAEVAFDILDANGDPIITKTAGTGNVATLGDGSLDLMLNPTGGTPELQMTGRANGQSVNTSCENVYCHSTVIKESINNDDRWKTNPAAPPLWNDSTSVKCGSCHDDNWTIVLEAAPFSRPAPPGHNGTNVLMSNASHDKHLNPSFKYEFALNENINAYYCDMCHTGRGMQDSPTTVRTEYHVNGKVELNINAKVGLVSVAGTITVAGTYTAGTHTNWNLPGDMTRAGSCDGVYCHSRGDEAKEVNPNFPLESNRSIIYATPTWSATLTCVACHGTAGTSTVGEPDYVNGGAGQTYANSHFKHVVGNGISCATCHDETTAIEAGTGNNIINYNTLATYQAHINGQITVNGFVNPTFPSLVYNTSSGTTANPEDENVKRCYNAPCHGLFDPTDDVASNPTSWRNAPQWGGTAVGGCFLCHGASVVSPELAVRPTEPVKVPGIRFAASPANKIDKDQYDNATTGTGHGIKAGYTYYGGDQASPGCYSTTPALPPGDPNEFKNLNPVDGCHLVNAPHFEQAGKPAKDPNDPYRLGTAWTGTIYNVDDISAFCTNCHFDPLVISAPENIINASHTPDVTGAYLDPAGFPTWPFVPKCVDCHDPHGDANIKMVRDTISWRKGSNKFGTPLADDGVTVNNVELVPEVDNPAYDDTLNPALLTTLIRTVSFTQNALAGDYYNTTGDDSICQVCHTQVMVYRNTGHTVKRHDNGITDLNNGFVPENSVRTCTLCHLHDNDSNAIRGFARPFIDIPTSEELLCEDCHVWNPNGDAAHPLMVEAAAPAVPAGGLLTLINSNGDNPNDQNDDILSPTYGKGDGGSFDGNITLTQRVPYPTFRANFADRSMIDLDQWLAAGHGNNTTLPNTNAWNDGGSTGPGLLCEDCHDKTVPHGYIDTPVGAPQYTYVAPYEIPNPKREMGGSTYIIGHKPDSICLSVTTPCHGDPTRPSPDYRAGSSLAKHAFMGGYDKGLCIDCHDPHGDSSNAAGTIGPTDIINDVDVNAAMLRRTPVFSDRWDTSGGPNPDFGKITALNSAPIFRYVANDLGSDFVNNATLGNGICEVCHMAAGPPPLAETNYFRKDNADGLPEASMPKYHATESTGGTTCIKCHKLKEPYICECDTCHSGVVTSQINVYDLAVPEQEASRHNMLYNPPPEDRVLRPKPPGVYNAEADCLQDPSYQLDCLTCHDLDADVLNHSDGMVHLKATPTPPQSPTTSGGVTVSSPSTFTENNTHSITDRDLTQYGNIKAADPDGAWCGTCHTAGSTFSWSGDAETPPDTTTYFTLSGHGATAGTNFTRYAPNDTNGRASCTACHNYHGTDNKAIVMRATWNSGTTSWDEPFLYPYVDNFVVGTNADEKEMFCIEACHINNTDPDFGALVAAARGATPNTMRAHYIFDWTNNLGAYDQHRENAYYFVSKAVGFYIGGPRANAGISKYIADTNAGEPVVYNESAADITLSLPLSVVSPDDEGRALCTTCHNPHGTETDNTWGHAGTPPIDDNMLREKNTSGVEWPKDGSAQYVQCKVCHPAAIP